MPSRGTTLKVRLGNVIDHTLDHTLAKTARRRIRQDIRAAWDRFPSYIHYDPSCWKTNPSPQACFMCLVLYLEYLDLNFVIERLVHVHTNRDDSALLAVAASLLTTASSLRHLSQDSGTYEDSMWIVGHHLDLKTAHSSLTLPSCYPMVSPAPRFSHSH